MSDDEGRWATRRNQYGGWERYWRRPLPPLYSDEPISRSGVGDLIVPVVAGLGIGLVLLAVVTR